MAWARVDDGWWCHPKVLALDLEARGLWVSALSWSCAHRTDTVPFHLLRMLGADEGVADRLADAGLWHRVDGGWQIHDWDDYQERTLSEKRADAGRKGGRRSGETRSKRQAKDPVEDDSGGEETGPDQHKHEAEPEQPDVASGSKRQANSEAGTRPVPSRPDPAPRSSALSPTGDDEIVRQFEAFWEAYPKRNGKRIGKANALIEWRKLNLDERRRAYIGARHLARSDQLPKDPERFLRRAKGGKGDYPFDDWQDPPDVDSRKATGDDLRTAAEQLRKAGR